MTLGKNQSSSLKAILWK